MNKTFKKLSLSRTSVRVLRGSHLGGVAGGKRPPEAPTNLCTTDRPTESPPCNVEPTLGCSNNCPTFDTCG